MPRQDHRVLHRQWQLIHLAVSEAAVSSYHRNHMHHSLGLFHYHCIWDTAQISVEPEAVMHRLCCHFLRHWHVASRPPSLSFAVLEPSSRVWPRLTLRRGNAHRLSPVQCCRKIHETKVTRTGALWMTKPLKATSYPQRVGSSWSCTCMIGRC